MSDDLPSDVLSKRLSEVADKFKAFKDTGFDEEILIIYLKAKTKLSGKAIKSMLLHTEDFFEKLIKNDLLAAME